MYYQFFGLSEPPFSIAVNPRYLFMSARHRDALAHLLYGVGEGGGFILLTGEVGTGKTTINRCLLEQLPQETDIAIILNPALNAQELLASVCDEFGIDYASQSPTLKTLTDALHRFLLANHERGRKTVLLIDEAQHLDFDVLEQIRLLTNLETNSEKLLQIILIGQPELTQMLARPELRQLNQRITARYNLEALNLQETGAYIHHRLQVAGMRADREVFPPKVVRGIHRVTRGIPRVINVLCDRVLLGAYGQNKTSADMSTLKQATVEVLGGQAPVESASRWWWLAACLLVGVGLVVAGWFLRSDIPILADPGAASEPALSVDGPGVASRQADAPESESVVAGRASQQALVRDGVSRLDSSVVSTVADETGLVDTAEPSAAPSLGGSGTQSGATSGMSAALLAPQDGLSQLWRLHAVSVVPTWSCPKTNFQGVTCVASEAQTWDDIALYNRPIVLEMITPARFAAETLLLEIKGTTAWVYTPGGEVAVELAELAPLWTGKYQFLWRAPDGFSQPLTLGDNSPAVTAVAQLFARLDGQSKPLAENAFTAPLQQRVRLFQSANGLASDGVVGLRTLLALNEQLGMDVTSPLARLRLQGAAGEQE
ncbi:MAG: AAA family ATPase [Halioglobus sp.]